MDPLDLAEIGYSPCISLLALARAEQQQRHSATPAKSLDPTSKFEQEQTFQTKVESEQIDSIDHLEGGDYSSNEDTCSEQLFSDDDHRSFLSSSSSPSFFSHYNSYSPALDLGPSRSPTPFSIAERGNVEPTSPSISPTPLRAQPSFSPLLDIDLDEIPSSPSPISAASFDELSSSIRLVSNSPSCSLNSSGSPIRHSERYTSLYPNSPVPDIASTPAERWSLTEVERAERGQASVIYDEEHLVGASKFYAPHLEVPRAKRVGGWGMPAWAGWSDERVEAWAREEGI